MIWFQPNKERTTYQKQLLHPNEEPFFVSGDKSLTIKLNQNLISPAICFESLQNSHAKNAANQGSNIYLASVAKSQSGIYKAEQHYPTIALNHNMTVVMANCIGAFDDFVASGQSAAWDSQGKLIANMGTKEEGVLLVNTESNTAAILAE